MAATEEKKEREEPPDQNQRGGELGRSIEDKCDLSIDLSG